jgi:hypothetical protein
MSIQKATTEMSKNKHSASSMVVTHAAQQTAADLMEAYRKEQGSLNGVPSDMLKIAATLTKTPRKATLIEYDCLLDWLSACWPAGLAWPKPYEGSRRGRPQPVAEPPTSGYADLEARNRDIVAYRAAHTLAATAAHFKLSIGSVARISARTRKESHGTTTKGRRKRTAPKGRRHAAAAGEREAAE